MGNVHASSSPPPPPPTAPPGVTPYSPVPDEGKTSGQTTIENPGLLEEIHRKCKDVFPTNFDGAKLMLTRGLSNHFQISHTLNMSQTTPSGYRFGATYVGCKQISPAEAYPILLGDIDPAGNLNATMIHQLHPKIRGKFVAQIQNSKFSAAQMSLDYRGDDFTATATVANPDLINGSGVLVLHYLQSITNNLALGAEIAYQAGAQIPGGEIAILSAAGRYSTDCWTASGTIGAAGVHLCYYQKASKQLQVGVELESNFRLQESVASIGYQVDLPKNDLVFRGHVDSNWSVGAVLEKRLNPMPFTIALSGLMNHSKNQFRVGVGLMVG